MGKFNRKENTRKEKKIIFIFAEGERTEPIYFESKKKEIEAEIRRKGIKIEIKGTGNNTLSLVDFAIDYINNEKIDLTLDDCWVVFDKDDFNKNFNNAISKAQENKLKVAYSNEAFELWFLLHFCFMNSAISRSDYNNKLTENYIKLTKDKKYKYDKAKNVLPLIEIIRSKELDAIKNSKKLINQHDGENSFLKKNPSTTVHLLVEDLNKLKD
jgi:hypothetical protein